MIYIFYSLLFMLGASLASFIAADIYRDKLEGENKNLINKKKSFCDNCKVQLRWYQNIPIFSYFYIFLLNKSKAKCCNHKVNIEYIALEIASGLLLVLTFDYLLKYSFINIQNININENLILLINISVASIFSSFVTYLTYQDYKYKEVSSKVLFSFLFTSIIFYLIFSYLNYFILNINLLINLSLAFIYSLPLLCIYLFSRGRAIGLADPIYFIAIILFFNTLNLSASINIFLYTIWSGSLISLIYMYIKYKKYVKNIEMPFLPFFALGIFILLISNFYIIQISDILILWDYFLLN